MKWTKWEDGEKKWERETERAWRDVTRENKLLINTKTQIHEFQV